MAEPTTAARRLKRFVDAARSEMERRRADLSFSTLMSAVQPAAGDRFARGLSGFGISVIAECKYAGPSSGTLKNVQGPEQIGRAYAAAGAAAISVLTLEKYFNGSPAFLQAIAAAVPKLPVLRKDFIVDTWQVYEARYLGAESCLLITTCLRGGKLPELIAACRELGMEPLVESHSSREVERALDAGARIIGVNNRNLATLAVDPDHGIRLLTQMQLTGREAIFVAESGIDSRRQLQRMHAAGFSAALVGTALMKRDDPGRALAELLNGDTT